MSSERAEFIFDGDATKVVSELYRFTEVLRQAKAEAKKLAPEMVAGNLQASESFNKAVKTIITTEEAVKKLNAAVKQYQASQKEADSQKSARPADTYALQELDHYRLASKEMEEINRRRLENIANARETYLRREAIATQRHLAATGVDAGSTAQLGAMAQLIQHHKEFGKSADNMRMYSYTVRNSFTQMSYAVNDFLSVSGGAQERIRAIANNIQYMAVSIPGPWGIAMNVMTMATQVGLALSMAFSKSKETMAEHSKQILSLSEYYQKLTDEIERATLGQDKFDLTLRKRDQLRQVAPLKAEREVTDMEIARMNRNIEWAKRQGFDADQADVGGREALVKRRLELNDEINKLENAFKVRENALQRQLNVRDAEKAVGPARDSLEKIYKQDISNRVDPAAAMKRLSDLITKELPDNLKTVGPDVARSIVDKVNTDVRGEQLANRIAGKTPKEAALENAERQLENERRRRDQLEIDFNKDRFLAPNEKIRLKEVDNFIDTIILANKKLKREVEDEKEAEKARLMQAPIPAIPPPVNRNGNR